FWVSIVRRSSAMSRELAQSFIAKVNADADFKGKFAGYGDDVSALLAAAGQVGYSFTAEEYRAALAEMAGELSDADLQSVNGGIAIIAPPVPAVQDPGGTQINWGNQPHP